MLESSTLEMVRHLRSPPPAFAPADLSASPIGLRSNTSRQIEILERIAEEYEDAVARWVAVTDHYVALVVGDVKAGPLSAADLEALQGYLASAETALAEEASFFTRQRKAVLQKARGIRTLGREERAILDGLNRRYIAALAKRGRAKADTVFALRSLIADAQPGMGRGPVFDDPAKLEAYLRAAVA